MNQQKIMSALVVMVVTFAYCLVGGYAMYLQMYFIFGALVALPFGVYFLNNPRVVFMAMVMTFFSSLRVPYLLADFRLFHLFGFVFVGIGTMDFFLRKTRPKLNKTPGVLLGFFMATIITVMAVRGGGFRFLGSTHWGGMRYIMLFLACLIYLNSLLVTLSPKQWKWTVFISFLMGVLPFVAEAIFVFSGGVIEFHYRFFSFAGSTAVNLVNTLGDGEGVGRLQTGRLAGESLILIAMVYVYGVDKRKIPALFLGTVGIVLIAMSGHRVGLLRAVGVVWVFFALENRKHLGFYMAGTLIAGVFAVLAAYFVAPMLPLAAQRMISFLPGIAIDPVAHIDAHSTTEWRLNLWRMALGEIPDYIWIGKGYTFPSDILDALALSGSAEYVEFWAIETSAYHNGVLSMLIGLGVVGLVIGTAFLVSLLVRHCRLIFQPWRDEQLRMVYQSLFCLNAVIILFFFTLYGDVQVTFPKVLFIATLMEGIAYVHTRSADQSALEASEK